MLVDKMSWCSVKTQESKGAELISLYCDEIVEWVWGFCCDPSICPFDRQRQKDNINLRLTWATK